MEEMPNAKLKSLIARNLDKIKDDDMFGLVDYIEAICPSAVVEKSADSMKINLDSFSNGVYQKVWEYVQKVVLRKNVKNVS